MHMVSTPPRPTCLGTDILDPVAEVDTGEETVG